ncbi:MAG: hypothetical protein IKG08_08595 [Eubacterium sp.]|nr:hypothetical protein [Eubacterium sp.]
MKKSEKIITDFSARRKKEMKGNCCGKGASGIILKSALKEYSGGTEI